MQYVFVVYFFACAYIFYSYLSCVNSKIIFFSPWEYSVEAKTLNLNILFCQTRICALVKNDAVVPVSDDYDRYTGRHSVHNTYMRSFYPASFRFPIRVFPKKSFPTEPHIDTAPPSFAQATAWLAPFPPPFVIKPPPVTVSPSLGVYTGSLSPYPYSDSPLCKLYFSPY